MDKVLVIGSGGLLGGALLRLGHDRYHMFGTYNTHKTEGNVFFHLDVTRRQDVFRVLERVKPDVVIDTHALHNVDYCETHPEETWLVNVEGTKNVAEASKRAGAKYVFISTDYIFDGKKQAYTEKDKPRPLNYYAKTKWAAELILEALNINYIIARSAVLYGQGGSGKVSFVLWMIDKLRNREQVNIITDQHNNPTFVDNLAEILFKLCDIDVNGTFHITGTDCLSRYDYALRIAKMFNLDRKLINPLTSPELNQIAQRPEKVNMSTNKVERVSGLKSVGVDEGLARLKKQLGE